MPVDVHATFWNVAERHVRQEQLGAARHVDAAEDLVESVKMSPEGVVELVIADHEDLPAGCRAELFQPTARETPDRDGVRLFFVDGFFAYL